jgi:hypothetical protein
MVLEGSRFKYENMSRVGCKLQGCAYVNVLSRRDAGEPGLIEAFEYHTQLQFVTEKAGFDDPPLRPELVVLSKPQATRPDHHHGLRSLGHGAGWHRPEGRLHLVPFHACRKLVEFTEEPGCTGICCTGRP